MNCRLPTERPRSPSAYTPSHSPPSSSQVLEHPSGSAGRRTALSQYLHQLKADMDQYHFERYTAPELDNVKWQVMQVRVIRAWLAQAR